MKLKITLTDVCTPSFSNGCRGIAVPVDGYMSRAVFIKAIHMELHNSCVEVEDILPETINFDDFLAKKDSIYIFNSPDYQAGYRDCWDNMAWEAINEAIDSLEMKDSYVEGTPVFPDLVDDDEAGEADEDYESVYAYMIFEEVC